MERCRSKGLRVGMAFRETRLGAVARIADRRARLKVKGSGAAIGWHRSGGSRAGAATLRPLSLVVQ